MSTIDILSWVLLIGFAVYGIYKGSCILLFTGIFILLAGLLAQMLGPICSSFITGGDSAVATSQLILFLLLCGVSIPLGILANRFFTVTFEPFEWVLGLVLGLVTGLLVVHFLLGLILGMNANTPQYARLKRAYSVRQFVYFDGWHRVTAYMTNLDTGKTVPKAPE